MENFRIGCFSQKVGKMYLRITLSQVRRDRETTDDHCIQEIFAKVAFDEFSEKSQNSATTKSW